MRQKDFPLLRDRRSPAVLDVEDGEIDEEEEMDRNVIALEDTHWNRKDWVDIFRKRLGVPVWGPLAC